MPYRDTQCGAKIFTRKSIEKIIPKLGVTEWAFDVDLLYQSHKLGLKVKEHPTVWKDKEGSKINLKRSSLQMFLAVARLRLVNSGLRIFAKPLKFLVRPVWRLVK
jgi:dolichyl-phosphate beta-glucosyltransferase